MRDWLRRIECEKAHAGYEPKGIEAFTYMFQQAMCLLSLIRK